MKYADKQLIVIVGPTAVGKTAIAIQIAKHFNTEIISADSRQIYMELTIGTAKPSAEELMQVPHHFINCQSIHNEYDAAQFGEDSLSLIYKLFEKYNEVVVCGGSGLYIKGLLEGFDNIPEIPDEVRDQLIEKFESNGLVWLQEKMLEVDLEHFQKIDQQNPMRLMRALEVKIATGNSIAYYQTSAKKMHPFKIVKIGLEEERDTLYNRINVRMEKMIIDGLFEEAQSLYPLRHLNALQTVGYREIFEYLDNEYDKEEAIRLLKRNTRRYAKRQMTWFKRDEEIKWFTPDDKEGIIRFIQNQ